MMRRRWGDDEDYDNEDDDDAVVDNENDIYEGCWIERNYEDNVDVDR
jgi:hypothetical protein